MLAVTKFHLVQLFSAYCFGVMSENGSKSWENIAPTLFLSLCASLSLLTLFALANSSFNIWIVHRSREGDEESGRQRNICVLNKEVNWELFAADGLVAMKNCHILNKEVAAFL